MSRLSAEIESAFRDGALILTANLRAALWLRQEYALTMRAAGRGAWKTPAIEDWDTFVRRLWQAASVLEDDAPMVLTELQERMVWQRMLHDDAKLLVSPEGMAKLAAGAYSLLASYEAHDSRNYAWGQPDAERFRHWSLDFDPECRKFGWLSRSALERKLTELLAGRELALPGALLLVGFDRLTPSQETLLGAVRARGVAVAAARDGDSRSAMRLVRANDLRDEITVCAWWVRRLLEAAADGELSSGGIRIGVVVPDLGSVRAEMERTFRRVLMPEMDDIAAPVAVLPFEFSLGQPLSDVAVIKAAMLLLRWAAGPLREEEVSWLLLSGFLTDGDAERMAAARFDASLREASSLSMEITLARVRTALDHPRWTVLRGLQQRLLQIEKAAAANSFSNDMRLPSAWADLAQALLKQAGWPGRRRGDAALFQVLARWERSLEDVSLLDFDPRAMAFGDFLHALGSHASETIFALESVGAPVQIMGALEASGQGFDALWFLGADDASWPLRGRAHPLLPHAVQEKAGMPHGTAEADFELSRAVTERLAWSAPVVVVSHAARSGDGELRPSPLVRLIAADAVWEESSALRSELEMPEALHTAGDMEEIADASGVIAWPVAQSAGGAEELKDQAACPFRAFAAKRLGARELNRSDWGLTAAERGNLLHEVLRKIWEPDGGLLGSLDALLAAKREDRLRGLVEETVTAVFAKMEPAAIAAESTDVWLRAYLDSERKRLCKRILEWMEQECTRTPFNVIACEEDLPDVSVGGLKLRLRADRIDEVAGYKRLLLDYKTGGGLSVADWNVPRPNQPQLPLYAAFGNVDDVCGVVFARIRAGETCLIGRVNDARTQLCASAGATSGLVKFPYTDAVRDEWSEALLTLAQEFLRGEAAVDPKEGRKTCEYCPLPGLCRVAERPAVLAENEIVAGMEAADA